MNSSSVLLSLRLDFPNVTVDLRMLNKPIISLQSFQQKKSRSDDCFWQSVYTNILQNILI